MGGANWSLPTERSRGCRTCGQPAAAPASLTGVEERTCVLWKCLRPLRRRC